MLDQALAALEARGYRALVHPAFHLRHGVLAGDDRQRADALMSYFLDPQIDAVLCTRGGAGALMLLDLLDYEALRLHPKPFVGSSDVTALLIALYQKAGFVTFHGPLATQFAATDESRRAQDVLFSLIRREDPVRSFSLAPAYAERPGDARGVLIGGNLSLLASLIGTAYDFSTQDTILFFEDVDEPLYKIERMLTHLRLAGKFKGVRAVLVGQMVGILDEKPAHERLGHDVYGQDFRSLVLKHVPPSIPLAFDVPCGHGDFLTTFPIGAVVDVALRENACRLEVVS